MPIVWIGSVGAPKKVLPNVSFDIEFKRWYLTWPFKKVKLFTIIEDSEGGFVESRESFKTWWFWGNHIEKIHDSLDKNKTYYIKVGYYD